MEASMHFAPSDSPSAPKFKGEPLELGGVTYVVPPLSLGALKAGLFDRIRQSGEEGKGFDLALAMDVVLAALQRNYPSLTMALLDELPPSAVKEIVRAFGAVVRQSGLEQKDAPSEDASGNGAPGES